MLPFPHDKLVCAYVYIYILYSTLKVNVAAHGSLRRVELRDIILPGGHLATPAFR